MHNSRAPYLVIDKEQVVINVIGSYLRRYNIPVLSARDTQTGLDLLLAVNPALVMVSHRLEPFSGVELYARARSAGNNAPFIFTGCTMNHNERDLIMAIDPVPPYHFLPKPFTVEGLDYTLGQIFNGELQNRRPLLGAEAALNLKR